VTAGFPGRGWGLRPLLLAIRGDISSAPITSCPVSRFTVLLVTTRVGSEEGLMVWPQPTRVSPVKLCDTVARICRILANSNARLAARQRRKP
jgi:hypothetical protein